MTENMVLLLHLLHDLNKGSRINMINNHSIQWDSMYEFPLVSR